MDNEYTILIKYFGENFENYWGEIDNEYYTSVEFLKYYIFENSTIYYVQQILQFHYKYNIEYQYLWSNIYLDNTEEVNYFLSKFYYLIPNNNLFLFDYNFFYFH